MHHMSYTAFFLQIKVYAGTRYDDNGLHFANKFYFKARVREEKPDSANNYDFVVAILGLIAFLPLGTFLLAGLIGHKLISFSLSQYEKKPFLGKYTMLVKAIIVIMSPTLSILFLICHILAMIGLYDYSSEILLDSTTTDKKGTETEGFLIALHCTFSFAPLLVSIGVLVYYIYKEKLEKIKALLVFNIIYFGYFLPYMIIAFIDNPLQTIFVYIVLLIFITLFPLILFVASGLKYYFQHFCKGKDENKGKAIGFLFGFIALSLSYYLNCLILLFTIGGFNNFKDLRNLFWLILGTVLTALGGHIFKKMQEREKNKDEN